MTYLRFNPMSPQWGTPVHRFWAEDPALDVADGAEVLSWPNSGSNGTAATGTTGNVPTMDDDGINGHKALAFDGVDQELSVATGSVTQAYTVVGVITVPDLNDRKFISSASGNRALYISGGKVAIYSGNVLLGATTYSIGDKLVIVAVFDGNDSIIRVNGVTEITSGGSGNSGWDGFQVGTWEAGGFFGGGLSFGTLYDGDVTGEDWFAEFEQGLINYYTKTPVAVSRPGLKFNPLSPAYSNGRVDAFYAENIADNFTPGPITTWTNAGTSGVDVQESSAGSVFGYSPQGFAGVAPQADGLTTVSIPPAIAQPGGVIAIWTPTVTAATGNRRILNTDSNWRLQEPGFNNKYNILPVFTEPPSSRAAVTQTNKAIAVMALFDGADSRTIWSNYDGAAPQVDRVAVNTTGRNAANFVLGHRNSPWLHFIAYYSGDFMAEPWWPEFVAGLAGKYDLNLLP